MRDILKKIFRKSLKINCDPTKPQKCNKDDVVGILNKTVNTFSGAFPIEATPEDLFQKKEAIKISGSYFIKYDIIYELHARNKIELIDEFLEKCYSFRNIDKESLEKLKRAFLGREGIGSTGIGDGIAIPHIVTDNVNRLSLCFGLSHKGINFDSMDGNPSHIFFFLAAPKSKKSRMELKVLAKISVILKNRATRSALYSSTSRDQVFSIISDAIKQMELTE